MQVSVYFIMYVCIIWHNEKNERHYKNNNMWLNGSHYGARAIQQTLAALYVKRDDDARMGEVRVWCLDDTRQEFRSERLNRRDGGRANDCARLV